ncbi:dihydroorotase [Salinispira pacifica]|uniref:Dihydroorotase n=1 Tax=Salinispira pacifica TaxID=1307761 RepID=V5WDA5_9SPIO|nr:dihydroorotase [Salinispira pacifica]AHC13524.1 Dihydroorotase [Salinispira pacifica]
MIRIRKPDDFHIHLRQGPNLPAYLADAAGSFARALIMPNTLPPVNNPARLREYQQEISRAGEDLPDFQPLYTFKISGDITGEELEEMFRRGVTAGKYYPLGATTNAEDGVADHRNIFPVLDEMQNRDLVLCIHGEKPDSFVLDREKDFLPVLRDIRSNFPRLRIVLEHISTEAGIQAVQELGDRTAGTLTVHHLMRNLDHLLGGMLNPHLFCKPVLKTPGDQKALVDAAFSGSHRFFLGTDSAPHKRGDKECDCGCAGTYTAPVAIPALFQFFLEQGAIDKENTRLFQDFTSAHGADFYGLEKNRGELILENAPWKVPAEYHGVVPFLANSELQWRVL